METYRLIVFGKVQGVWYRKFVKDLAQELGYVGYVKNMDDGSVKVIVNIELDSELEYFINKLYEGSTFSEVKNIECQKIDFCKFDTFEIIE